MQAIASKLDTRSDDFRANAERMRGLVDDLRAKAMQVAQGGGDAARQKHLARGKLLPRDRVHRLLDPGSPFLEIGALAADDMYGGEAPGAGMICGVGRVSGREVMIVANDPTVKGGAYFPMRVKSQRLVVLEAMKMEHALIAPFDGVVEALAAVAGAQVAEGLALVRIAKDG
jgi:3-methylcrotonyl-CoA carboxylase beta subunit